MTVKTDKTQLFTQSLDAQTADIVRRIPGKTARFATPFIGMVAGDGTPLPSVRLEAWENPQTKLWQIDRFTRLPADGVIKQEIEARPGLCFFDALYHLSRFQTTELDGRGAQVIPVPGVRWEGVPVYEEAAKAAGQIIDAKDGLARPCAFGRVLTGGFIADADWERVLTTSDATLEERAVGDDFLTRSILDDVLTAAAPLAGTEQEWLEQANRKRDVINRFKAVRDAGDALTNRLSDSVEYKFKTDFEDGNSKKAIAKSIFSMGIIPAIGYMRGSIQYNIDKAFLNLKETFRKQAEGLPACPEKDLCLSFARSAEVAFWLERSARVITDCQERNETDLSAGLPFIEHAAAADGLSSVDQNRLKNEYLAAVWKSGQFWEKAVVQWHIDPDEEDEHGRRLWRRGRYNQEQGIYISLTAKIEALERTRKLQLPATVTAAGAKP